MYETIDALERTEIEIKEYTRYKELFGWFLIPALIFGTSEAGQTRTQLNNTIQAGEDAKIALQDLEKILEGCIKNIK